MNLILQFMRFAFWDLIKTILDERLPLFYLHVIEKSHFSAGCC